jgi:hypothetical protein
MDSSSYQVIMVHLYHWEFSGWESFNQKRKKSSSQVKKRAGTKKKKRRNEWAAYTSRVEREYLGFVNAGGLAIYISKTRGIHSQPTIACIIIMAQSCRAKRARQREFKVPFKESLILVATRKWSHSRKKKKKKNGELNFSFFFSVVISEIDENEREGYQFFFSFFFGLLLLAVEDQQPPNLEEEEN